MRTGEAAAKSSGLCLQGRRAAKVVITACAYTYMGKRLSRSRKLPAIPMPWPRQMTAARLVTSIPLAILRRRCLYREKDGLLRQNVRAPCFVLDHLDCWSASQGVHHGVMDAEDRVL